MYKIKKTFTLLIIFALSIFSFSTINTKNVSAADSPVSVSGTKAGVNDTGKYKVQEERAYNILPYGIVQYTHFGASSTTQNIGSNAAGSPSNIKNDPKANEGFVAGSFYDQQVNILEVPSTTGVKVTSWGNFNDNKWTLTSVKNLIADYETKHPDEMVVAAINGDFFDIGAKNPLPYQTSGILLSNGEHYKTSGGNSVAFTNDGTTNSLLGNKKITRKTYIELDLYDSLGNITKTFDVKKINEIPEIGETAVYYGNYDKDHNYIPIVTPENGIVYVVGKAELALPNSPTDFYGKGIVSSVGSVTLQKGQFAIVTTDDTIVNDLKIGTQIRVQWNFSGALANVGDATGGGGTIMSNSEWSGQILDRASRTIIGKRADGTIIMAIGDGRQPSKGMYGFAGDELAAMMKHYGAIEAYNLDGGGSSTMVIKQGNDFVVTNSPSDGWERSDANCLLVVVKKPSLNISVGEITQRSVSLNIEKLDINTHDMKKLFVSINNTDAEVINGKAEISGLQIGTTYSYSLYYRDSRDQRIPLSESGEVSTLNHMPVFRGVNVVDAGESFLISIDFVDRSNISNYKTAPLKINDKDYNFVNGQINVLKEDVGSEILTLSVLLKYNVTKTEEYSRWVNNPHVPYALSLEIMIETMENKINLIYK